MDGEEIKKAYLKLTAEERREVAHWILARELSGRAGASLKPQEASSKSAFPVKEVVLGVAVLLILVGGALAGFQYWEKQQKLEKKRTADERAAEEARRPHSPSNLGFLSRNVGNEITIRGVPQDSEVGYLYFSKSRKQALRLNLFSAGVVLMQSGDLEELVRRKQELEITGTLEKTPDGFYEIKVGAVNRLKKTGS